jgi:hypothetical protein
MRMKKIILFGIGLCVITSLQSMDTQESSVSNAPVANFKMKNGFIEGKFQGAGINQPIINLYTTETEIMFRGVAQPYDGKSPFAIRTRPVQGDNGLPVLQSIVIIEQPPVVMTPDTPIDIPDAKLHTAIDSHRVQHSLLPAKRSYFKYVLFGGCALGLFYFANKYLPYVYQKFSR